MLCSVACRSAQVSVRAAVFLCGGSTQACNKYVTLGHLQCMHMIADAVVSVT